MTLPPTHSTTVSASTTCSEATCRVTEVCGILEWSRAGLQACNATVWDARNALV